LRRGFESRGGCGGQVKVEVDRHMICDAGGERFAEYFALLDQGDMMFSDEIVVKDRVGVRFSKKVKGRRVGGGTGKRPFVIINSRELIIMIQE